MKNYYIRGVFFQPTEDSLVEAFFDSARIISSDDINCDDFQGSFGLASGVGEISDRWGQSVIFQIVLTERELGFVKRYVGRSDFIFYQFHRREDGVWVGKYTGAATGVGPAACVLWAEDEPEKILPEDLRVPPQSMNLNEVMPGFEDVVRQRLLEQGDNISTQIGENNFPSN